MSPKNKFIRRLQYLVNRDQAVDRYNALAETVDAAGRADLVHNHRPDHNATIEQVEAAIDDLAADYSAACGVNPYALPTD